MDCLVEDIRISKGLMGEIVSLEMGLSQRETLA